MGIQPNYSTLDGAALGAALEIQESGLVVTCNIQNATMARKVRARLPKTTGVWCYEVAYYTQGAVSPAGLVSLGICTALSTLNTGTGVDGSSYGYRAPDGGIFNNNVQIKACAASAAKSYIGVVVDLDNSTLSIYNDGGLIATQAISPAGGLPVRVYYPCFTVGSGSYAYSVFQFVNFGQRAFAYPYPGATGWFSVPNPPPAIYLGPVGDGAYSSAATDTPANRAYEPAITNLDDFSVEKSASVNLWKETNGSATYSYLDIDNTLGGMGRLLEQDYRDSPVYVRQLLDVSDTLAGSAHTVATAFVDRVEPEGENTIRVYLKGRISTLQGSLQRRVFPPFMAPGVAGRPVPIIAGAVRSFDVGAFLTDEASRVFQLSDSQITNIGVLRDRGNPLSANATPPQFVPTNDLQGVIPETLPEGKFTSDLSSQGPQNIYPGAPDVLNGTGSNWDSAWIGPSAPPPGWVLTNTDSPTYTSAAIKQGSVQGFAHEMIQMSSNRPISAIGSGREFSLRSNGQILRAGKKYRISITMWDFQSGGVNPGGGLCVMSAQVGYLNGAQWISPYQRPLTGGFHSELPFQLVYEVPAGADRYLYFTVAAGQFQTCSCMFRNIIVEEMAESIVDVPLVGIGFRDYMDKILTQRARLSPSEWSGADCDVLDAAYPGSPLGLAITEAVTIESAARLPMDSVCGTITEDRNAVLRFRRLVDPRDATPVATYTEDEMDYPVVEWQDYAEGLTQTIGNQRNWTLHGDSDFVSDTTLVPAALRTQLKRKSRIIQVCSLQLRNAYQFATLAGALDTVFDDPAIAIAELERINRPFSYERPGGRPPGFVLFTINFDGVAPDHLFGDVLRINYMSRSGLTFPRFVERNVATVKTKLMLGKQKLQVLGWG